MSSHRPANSAILGAAFLMATSAIGPGFLTQTSLFTAELLASFGFVILISVLLDIGVQLNIWRIITATQMRAQELAQKAMPGTGYLLALLIGLGGLIFNIGNIAGCGLGLNVLFGIPTSTGALISGIIAIAIFWYRDANKFIDQFVKILGLLMIALTVYVAFTSSPPLGKAVIQTFWPEKIDVMKIVTLVGGTVGGYISFAGAHRLLDAGISGKEHMQKVNRSAVSGILITSFMRYILFLAVLGVVVGGFVIDPSNPPASVFKAAAGQIGYLFFGVVLWSAAITSVIGASYTTISFWKKASATVIPYEKIIISLFILVSTLIFVFMGQPPVKLLIMAGAINGIILPVALALLLIAARKKIILEKYNHPTWLQVIGWLVVAIMTVMSVMTMRQFFD